MRSPINDPPIGGNDILRVLIMRGRCKHVCRASKTIPHAARTLNTCLLGAWGAWGGRGFRRTTDDSLLLRSATGCTKRLRRALYIYKEMSHASRSQTNFIPVRVVRTLVGLRVCARARCLSPLLRRISFPKTPHFWRVIYGAPHITAADQANSGLIPGHPGDPDFGAGYRADMRSPINDPPIGGNDILRVLI